MNLECGLPRSGDRFFKRAATGSCAKIGEVDEIGANMYWARRLLHEPEAARALAPRAVPHGEDELVAGADGIHETDLLTLDHLGGVGLFKGFAPIAVLHSETPGVLKLH
jgi:hypothetical protein